MAISHLILSSLGTASGSGGGGIPSVVNSGAGHGTDAFTTAAISSTSGNLFLLFFNCDPSASSFTISDSKGNTYTRLDSGTRQTHVYACENGVGGSGHTVTVTPNVTGTFIAGALVEISGAATSGASELYAEADDTSSPFDISITTSATNRLLLAMVSTVDTTGGAADTIYSASGWTKVIEETNWTDYETFAVLTKDAASAGSSTASVTDSTSHTLETDLAVFAVHA